MQSVTYYLIETGIATSKKKVEFLFSHRIKCRYSIRCRKQSLGGLTLIHKEKDNARLLYSRLLYIISHNNYAIVAEKVGSMGVRNFVVLADFNFGARCSGPLLSAKSFTLIAFCVSSLKAIAGTGAAHG